MKGNNRHINGKKPGDKKIYTGNGFDDDMMFTNEDSAIFGEISSYMRARLDIEDVKENPSLDLTRDIVVEMISDYKTTLLKNRENSKFIKEALSECCPEKKVNSEIDEIKSEIGKSDLKDITAEWVSDWHKKMQSNGIPDPHSNEIKDFISGALKPEIDEPARKTLHITKKRSYFIRYASLAAAALIGAVVLINALLPSSDQGKIFDSYYQPFNAISPVTRSLNGNKAATLTSAIESYKAGKYDIAESGFSVAMVNDPDHGSPVFFLGLTELAQGNYEKAISHLKTEIARSGEYSKEANWYLGLTYLRTGNNIKAKECFEPLTQSTGFYNKRSAEILRRLK